MGETSRLCYIPPLPLNLKTCVFLRQAAAETLMEFFDKPDFNTVQKV